MVAGVNLAYYMADRVDGACSKDHADMIMPRSLWPREACNAQEVWRCRSVLHQIHYQIYGDQGPSEGEDHDDCYRDQEGTGEGCHQEEHNRHEEGTGQEEHNHTEQDHREQV